eukprot:scaffold38028_cov191-Amphora_coffeaeformis.AAC.6
MNLLPSCLLRSFIKDFFVVAGAWMVMKLSSASAHEGQLGNTSGVNHWVVRKVQEHVSAPILVDLSSLCITKCPTSLSLKRYLAAPGGITTLFVTEEEM